MRRDRLRAKKRLAELAGCHDWVVLDTETTGLGCDDKIICVAIVAAHGEMHFHSPVRPTVPIHPKALAVNGLTDEMVADAAAFADVYPRLVETLTGEHVLAITLILSRNVLL